MFNRITGSLKRWTSSSGQSPNTDRRQNSSGAKKDLAAEEDDPASLVSNKKKLSHLPVRNGYCRPYFLGLSSDEETRSQNVAERLIVKPEDEGMLPLGTGYAECINGGKSSENEDQAAAATFVLPSQPNGLVEAVRDMDIIDVQYFGVFDGHAGSGAALMAADQLVNHLQEKMVEIQEDLCSLRIRESLDGSDVRTPTPTITIDSLVRGALEAAFVDFDEHIARERSHFNIAGGCAAIVVLVLLDRVYVAHAGDCRAVAYLGQETIELATEFTPETDGERIQYIASLKPELTNEIFSDTYYLRPLSKKDLGHSVLCRKPQRSGWHYREITEEDLGKPPLVAGQGKWARLMGTIGVTRGFGDYDLTVAGTNIKLKPFLSAVPQVRVLNLGNKRVTEDDVLVVGCDGLWDMVRNEQVGGAIKESLAQNREDSRFSKYTHAAEDVVHLARGDNSGRGWKMKDGHDASFDDITAFVIPLFYCLSANRKRKSGRGKQQL